MGKTYATIGALAAILAFAGCGRQEMSGTPNSPTSQEALDIDNGVELNGVKLNGVKLNGIKLNGIKLNGIKLNGIKLNGITLNGIKLNGTSISGVDINGTQLQGPDLIGATFDGVLSNGMTISLRLDDVQANPDPTNADVWLYMVSYDTGRHGQRRRWQPLCGVDTNQQPIPSTALEGTWDYTEGTPTGGSHIDDPDTFTFACAGSALEKCVSFGYKPWQTSNGVSLANYHTACTRMIRADYCGDGEANTINGTPIDIFDGLGLQLDTESNWPIEAEWAADGARCIARTRIAHRPIACSQPHTYTVLSNCGDTSHFNTGTLLIDRTEGPAGHGHGGGHGHNGP